MTFQSRFDVLKHEGLVRNEVRRWVWVTFSGALDEEDLLQAGRMGVLHAASKFNEDRGVKFSTYAVPWIHDYVEKEAMNKCRTVRVGFHEARRAYKEGKSYPTENSSIDRLNAALDDDAGRSRVAALLGLVTSHAGEDDAMGEAVQNIIAAAIHELDERTAQVIRWSFFEDLTNVQIAKRLSVTRERVRQLVSGGLRIIKRHLEVAGVDGV